MGDAPTSPQPRRSAAADRGARWLLAVVFVAGAALMAFELIGSRILAPYFGTSIIVWGSLIGVFLGALAAGYTVGGRISDRWPSASLLAGILLAASVLVAITEPLAGPVQRAIVSWDPGVRLNPALAAIVLFGPASILIGMVSPFAVRLHTSSIARVGSTAGMLYGLSTLGSIVGTMLTAWWLIFALGTAQSIYVVAAALATCATVAAWGAQGMRARGATLILVSAIIVVVGTVLVALGAGGERTLSLASNAEKWSPVFRDSGYESPVQPATEGMTVKEELDSNYHHIQVVDLTNDAFNSGKVEGQTGVRAMRFDSLFQSAARIIGDEPDQTADPVFRYIRALDMVRWYHPTSKSMLYIGLGAGTAPARMATFAPKADIQAVEIDGAVVDMAEKWFAHDSKRIPTHVQDGRQWLAASGEKFDVIVIDAYFADSIPFHMTTVEFLEVVRDHLTDDGVVAANLIGAMEGERSRLLRSFVRTYTRVFGQVHLYPIALGEGELDPTSITNIELFAGRNKLRDVQEIERLAASKQLDEGGMQADSLLTRIVADRYTLDVDTSGVPLLTDDYAPVDSLLVVTGSDAER